MPKEVRLNDKMWFGRYKGRTIMDILECDKSFLDSLLFRNKITYHKNVMDYLNGDGNKYSWVKIRQDEGGESDQGWDGPEEPVIMGNADLGQVAEYVLMLRSRTVGNEK
jgi:hypothetical protein